MLTLTHGILINKGFSLNEYPEGKYYELVEKEESKVENILKVAQVDYDQSNIDEEVILQMKEDFSNKLICVSGNVWDLNDFEFQQIIEVL